MDNAPISGLRQVEPALLRLPANAILAGEQLPGGNSHVRKVTQGIPPFRKRKIVDLEQWLADAVLLLDSRFLARDQSLHIFDIAEQVDRFLRLAAGVCHRLEGNGSEIDWAW